MVQMRFSFIALITATSFSLAGATPFARRTVAKIEEDLSSLAKDLTALDTSINNFPNSGGTLQQALPIHTNAMTVCTMLKTAAADTNANPPFSTSDGDTILNSVAGAQATIKDALNSIVAKKPALANLTVGNIISLAHQDLIFLQGNSSDFGTALIAKVTSAQTAEATTLRDNIQKLFPPAISAYQ